MHRRPRLTGAGRAGAARERLVPLRGHAGRGRDVRAGGRRGRRRGRRGARPPAAPDARRGRRPHVPLPRGRARAALPPGAGRGRGPARGAPPTPPARLEPLRGACSRVQCPGPRLGHAPSALGQHMVRECTTRRIGTYQGTPVSQLPAARVRHAHEPRSWATRQHHCPHGILALIADGATGRLALQDRSLSCRGPGGLWEAGGPRATTRALPRTQMARPSQTLPFQARGPALAA